MKSKPTIKSFEISEGEEKKVIGEVTFRQITEGDFIALAELQADRDVLFEDNQFVGYRESRNRRASQRHIVYRTLASSTLQWEDEKKLVFDSKDGMVQKVITEIEFNTAWDMLPLEIADQIVGKMYEMNPTLLGNL